MGLDGEGRKTVDRSRRAVADPPSSIFRLPSSVFRLSWSFAATLLLALLLWALAYQAPYTQRLALGGDQAARHRMDDAPYLRGFNDPEPGGSREQPWWAQPLPPYRWASDAAQIELPGLGGGPWLVSIQAAGPPVSPPAMSQWRDAHVTTTVPLVPQVRRYHLLALPDTPGNLRLNFATPAFAAPGDPRRLGFVAYQLVAAPTAGLRLPAIGQLGWLSALLLVGYGLLRSSGLARGIALVTLLGLALLAALLLTTHRAGLAVFSPTLLGICLAAWLLALALRWLWWATGTATSDQRPATRRPGGQQSRSSRVACRVSHVFERLSSPHRLPALLTGLIALAFILRLGGMLHPHTIFSDSGLHANNLAGLTIGTLYFTEDLPARAGGGAAPYPPGGYLLLAPLQLLFPPGDAGRQLLLKCAAALLDSLTLAVIALLILRARSGGRAALLGAALYLLPKPVLASFSVGEFANLLGQALALPLLGLLSGIAEPQSAQKIQRNMAAISMPSEFSVATNLPGGQALLVALIGLALLGHSGVTLSVGLLLGVLVVIGVLAAVSGGRTKDGGRRTADGGRRTINDHLPSTVYRLLSALLIAGLLAVVLYYSAFVHLFAARLVGAAPATGQAPDALRQVSGLLATIDASRNLLNPLLLVLALGGLLLVVLAGRPPRAEGSAARVALRHLLLAWWLGTLLALLPLLFTNQTVRWSAFVYPALCLCGGLSLAAFWRRGRAGRAVGLLALGFLLWNGGAYWVVQLYEYLH